MAAEIICLGQQAAQTEGVNLVSRLLRRIGTHQVRTSQLSQNGRSLAETVAKSLKTNDIIFIFSSSSAGETLVREVISAGLGRRLELNQERLHHIRQYYQRSGRQMPESEARKAILPSGTAVFESKRGIDGGWAVSSGRQCIISLPSSSIDIEDLINNGLAQYLADFVGVPVAAQSAQSAKITSSLQSVQSNSPLPQGLKEESGNMPRTKRKKKGSFLAAIFPVKGDSKREKIRKSILLVSIVVFISSVSYIFNYFAEAKSNLALTEELEDLYNQGEKIKPPKGYPKDYIAKFAGLYAQNPDVIGYIEIPGTILKHPVVQSADNDYYLRRDFTRKSNQHGVPFMDYRVNVKEPSTNTIIYGHNMKDGQMFGELIKYESLAYYKKNPVINFDSVYREGKYKVLSVFITNAYEAQGPVFEYHNFINAKDDAHMTWFINEIRQRSLINTPVDVKTGDQLLTLSTCQYDFKDARLVVVARRVREGEDATVNVAQAKLNPNPKMPQVWYDAIKKRQEDELKRQQEEEAKKAELEKYKQWLLPGEIQDLDAEGQKRVAENRKVFIEKWLSRDEISSLTLEEMIELAEKRERNSKKLDEAKAAILARPDSNLLSTSEVEELAKILITIEDKSSWNAKIDEEIAKKKNSKLLAEAKQAIDKHPDGRGLKPEQKDELANILIKLDKAEWEARITRYVKEVANDPILEEAKAAINAFVNSDQLSEAERTDLANKLKGMDKGSWNTEITIVVSNKVRPMAQKAIADNPDCKKLSTEQNQALQNKLISTPKANWPNAITEFLNSQGSVADKATALQEINAASDSGLLTEAEKNLLADDLLKEKDRSKWSGIIKSRIDSKRSSIISEAKTEILRLDTGKVLSTDQVNSLANSLIGVSKTTWESIIKDNIAKNSKPPESSGGSESSIPQNPETPPAPSGQTNEG